MCYGQVGSSHLVGYDDSIVLLSPNSPIPPLLLEAQTAPKLCFFTVAGDAGELSGC